MKLRESDVRELVQLARDRGKRLDLRGRDLSGLGLYKADLSGADLGESDLTQINLAGGDLTGVDMGESLSRYLRAIYETEEPQSRPQALLEHMRWIDRWFIGQRLMLEDLIQVSPQPLPERDWFLSDWIVLLRTQDGRDADAWLREAVRLSQGARGLEALARAEGKAHPRAYLDWFSELEREDKHRELLLAAQEALQTLKRFDPFPLVM